MKLVIESNEQGVTASFEGSPIDAVDSIAEVMVNNEDLCRFFKAAVEVVNKYEELVEFIEDDE